MNDFLPQTKEQFFKLLTIFFPNVYDLKSFIASFYPNLENSGLNRIADSLGIERVGTNHQAGSDSYVTAKVFFHLKKKEPSFFEQTVSTYKGEIYGFSSDPMQYFPSNSRANTAP